MPFDEKHFEAVNNEVKRHLQDAESSKLAHWHAARIYENFHKFYLGLPITVFSIFLTWMISDKSNDSLINKILNDFIGIDLEIILSLLISVLSGLSAFLNLNEIASQHRNAAESLNSLWRECKNWATDFPDATQCDLAVKKVQTYRQRLNEINRDAPQIPRWAWKSVRQQKKEGSVSYYNENSDSC